MTCRFTTSTEPRVVIGRHLSHCADQYDTDSHGCRGCQPCSEPHCRVCGREHHDGTCRECMAEVRDSLREIARLCDALPNEVEHRGVEGEAMMLLGPVADPEAWGHTSASVASGRLSRDWVEEGGDERHPQSVLLTWQMVVRDALEHDEAPDSELATAVDYLDQNLTYLGGFIHLPFEDFARDLRTCRTHVEAVLHDGEQVDRGAPCMACGKQLERRWGSTPEQDGWQCPRCKRTSTESQYRFAVAHLHREEATELTDRDMETRTGVKAGTVRVWARRGLVRSRRDSGRVIYLVEDVERKVNGEPA